jgi:class 3 adenylate cyclase
MPIFLDNHKLDGATAADVAQAHALDVAVQGRYGVEFITYWFDKGSCSAFCLVNAPDAETAIRVHKEAHGLVPGQIVEVDIAVVEAFLGRITDPASTRLHAQPIDESALRAIMFTDIVGSTEMTARLGDARALEFVRAHDSLVRRQLAANSGREVKHVGDGIMAAFAEPKNAVACGCAIQRAVAAFNTAVAEPLRLRIGVHAGEPVLESNDLFGATVQMASRICADASVDAVVISAVVRDLIEDDFQMTPLGQRMLKGFPAPVPLFSVEWRDAGAGI